MLNSLRFDVVKKSKMSEKRVGGYAYSEKDQSHFHRYSISIASIALLWKTHLLRWQECSFFVNITMMREEEEEEKNTKKAARRSPNPGRCLRIYFGTSATNDPFIRPTVDWSFRCGDVPERSPDASASSCVRLRGQDGENLGSGEATVRAHLRPSLRQGAVR